MLIHVTVLTQYFSLHGICHFKFTRQHTDFNPSEFPELKQSEIIN